jgi:hypothetical protein
VRRLLTGFAAAFGISALVRLLRRRGEPPTAWEAPASDPADELRRRLEEARSAPDDRQEWDEAEGQPLDAADEPRSLGERRRAVHEQARETLGEMRRDDDE